MTITARLLASGPGWRVSDFVCSAGPRDPAFEESHDSACIAFVVQGSFQYRSSHGSALLAPGALLLGNEGRCFECGHEHGVGDRCLAFNFAPDYLEAVVAAVPGARQAAFDVPRLPPSPHLLPLQAAAEAARDDADGAALEELALRLAGTAAAELAGTSDEARTPNRRDAGRVTEALRHIEAHAEEKIALTELARDAATSPYHFLRVFHQVVGMTPHQFVLRTRLHRAAMRLRRTQDSVTDIALDVGFNDLSTFNRTFKRAMGVSPSRFRSPA